MGSAHNGWFLLHVHMLHSVRRKPIHGLPVSCATPGPSVRFRPLSIQVTVSSFLSSWVISTQRVLPLCAKHMRFIAIWGQILLTVVRHTYSATFPGTAKRLRFPKQVPRFMQTLYSAQKQIAKALPALCALPSPAMYRNTVCCWMKTAWELSSFRWIRRLRTNLTLPC